MTDNNYKLTFLEFGAVCSNFNSDSFCDNVQAMEYIHTEDFMYMTTSPKVFTYSDATNKDDGVLTYPSSTAGAISSINGGNKAIIIAQSKKSGDWRSGNSFYRAGSSVEQSYVMYCVKKAIMTQS